MSAVSHQPTTHPTSPVLGDPPTAAPAVAPASATWPLRRLGAISLALGPVLFAAGLVAAPTQDDLSREGFIASLVDDPTMAVVSANLLHYSWLAWVVGLIGVLGMVHGRGRGHGLTKVSAVLAILGAVQISGLLLGDLAIVSVGQEHGLAAALDVVENGTSGLVWTLSAQVLALLPVPFVFVGLARAGYLRWYLVVPMFLATAATGVPLPFHAGVVLSLLLQAAVFVIAFTLWRGPAATSR